MIAVPDSPGALDSVRVLDLATYLAAPVCATLLGEFGAEVIKVEQPRVGDDLRRLGRAAGPDAGGSYWWFVESRNKKSITCNLRHPEGQALIQRLVADSHVLTENFRPGTLERWNLGWEALSAIRRSLVMVRISAFGQTGPSRERPGFGRIAAAVGGLAYLSGYPDRPPVSPGTPTVPDYLAGVFGAVGALVALRHAERTGAGQVVDLALYEPVLRVLDDAIAVYGGTGHVRERIGSGTESAVPHNHFLTRDGRWIAIACTNDRMFARLLQAMGRTDLAGDARMTTTPARLAHRALVDDLVAGWVAARDASEALAALEAAEVPSSLVASVRDLFEDAHVRARENIVSLTLPLLGRLTMPGVVPRLTLTPGRIDAAGPSRPGEHNEEIYGGRLGLSREALAQLAERGVI
jgi:crotonobetainyl-CoA:carnitine CoA-transferase CaiB-like acyl-CoA transferase